MNKSIIDLLPEDILITGDYESEIVTVNGKQLFADRSQKLVNHSPDGFNWGYEGSGPAQLSLAILLEFMPEEMALKYYQGFKRNVVARLSKDSFHGHLNLREEIKKLIL